MFFFLSVKLDHKNCDSIGKCSSLISFDFFLFGTSQFFILITVRFRNISPAHLFSLAILKHFHISVSFPPSVRSSVKFVGHLRDKIAKIKPRYTRPLWARTIKNPDESTGPLACPFAHSLTPLTRLLAPQRLLCLRALLRSLICSLAHFAHPLAHEIVND